MAYAFGMRLDDDSNAITVIDEENQTATTTGYINGEPVNFGSSDLFSQVATIVQSVPVFEGMGTFTSQFGSSSAYITIASTSLNESEIYFIDSVTIEVGEDSVTLNNVAAIANDRRPFPEMGENIEVFFFIDNNEITLDIEDTTEERSDTFAIKVSSFNIYGPNEAIISIFPTLSMTLA